jgi:SAM-dependent methyltransferase
MAMKTFRSYLTEGIAADTRQATELLVDSIYSKYVDSYSRNDEQCVGWLDGSDNSLTRFDKIYEGGIGNEDSILDVGCGVAHLHRYLKNQGWTGKYLGIDPNKKAIDLIDEEIEAVHCTIEDLGKETKWDWVIANGVFNLGLKEEHTFWIIENMISHANKGIIFNMLRAPYGDDKYEAYVPNVVSSRLQQHEHKRIKIVEDYMDENCEFTIYFYV